jgi:hypothetical protein
MWFSGGATAAMQLCQRRGKLAYLSSWHDCIASP